MTADASAFTTDFAAEFPSDEASWRKAAEAALKGRPLDPVIRANLVDGTAFDAILPRASVRTIAGRPAGARWSAMARVDIADPAAANAQVLEDLDNGASGVALVLTPDGLGAATVDELDVALSGVMLDLVTTAVEAAPLGGVQAAALVAALVEKRSQKPADVLILFGLDMVRDALLTGAAPVTKDVADTVTKLGGLGFTSPALLFDGRVAHEAGASEAQELAGALSAAVEHVRTLAAHGLDAGTVLDASAIALAADGDQFATIAKLRAARLLWAALRREFGLSEKALHIHAETSRRMLTVNDSQTNIVRATIAAFAAGVGGADSVVVLPHSFALGAIDSDARRIARNVQSIVLEESNVYRVADPAAGAGAIEALTDALAEKAWDAFQEIETQGGMFAALKSGFWQGKIAETRKTRDRLVASRKIPLVGVSEFPKADEIVTPLVKPGPSRSGALEPGTVETIGEPLSPARLSEPFERLRHENEAAAQRPAVFLALLGPIARHSARAGFIRNLLAAGGLSMPEGPIDASADDIAAAFKASGARLAVVCGADGDYAETGAAVTEALKGAGAAVWLAGRPKEGREPLEAAGVVRFVAAGDDAIDILTEATKIAAKAKGGAA
jgi:methylmalonyl-CoA mutase